VLSNLSVIRMFLVDILGSLTSTGVSFHNNSLTNSYDTTLAQLRWHLPPLGVLATQTCNIEHIKSCFYWPKKPKTLANPLAGHSQSLQLRHRRASQKLSTPASLRDTARAIQEGGEKHGHTCSHVYVPLGLLRKSPKATIPVADLSSSVT
jgi:hypothetical protein